MAWGGRIIETDHQDSFYIDNANLVSVPGYTLVNLNLHYNKAFTYKYFTGLHLFFEVRNVFDKTYVASAGNVSDSINATTGAQNLASSVAAATGSIYADLPRSFFGGVRLNSDRQCERTDERVVEVNHDEYGATRGPQTMARLSRRLALALLCRPVLYPVHCSAGNHRLYVPV